MSKIVKKNYVKFFMVQEKKTKITQRAIKDTVKNHKFSLWLSTMQAWFKTTLKSRTEWRKKNFIINWTSCKLVSLSKI